MSGADRQVLKAIEELAPRSGAAEDEHAADRLRVFLPTPSFLQAIHPSILLVIGERGTGKTELFEVVRHGGYGVFAVAANSGALPPTQAVTIGELDWRQAELSKLFASGSEVTASAFWLGMLVRKIWSLPAHAAEAPLAVRKLLDESQLTSWVALARDHLGELYAALDALDAELDREGIWLVALYDQLDRITLTYRELFPPLRSLLQLWFEQRRRWRRIRPKVFLRPDLFDADTLAFPDGSKFFRASQRELVWDRSDLHRMWLKRLVNGAHGDSAVAWLNDVAPRTRINDLPGLGRYPEASEPVLKALVHNLVGPYMGAGARKGESYNWVTNHVEDARGRMAPRSFLVLWQEAASRALQRADAQAPLMSPEDFTHGLRQASDERLRELAEDDPWMKGLQSAFAGVRVPTERIALEECLRNARWETPPPYDPVHEAPLLLDHLVKRGVVSHRMDHRVSVPDLYLLGLGMKRKGGAKRG